MATFILSNENVNLNYFVTPSGRPRNPNLGRNLLFADPWYIALHVGQQSLCMLGAPWLQGPWGLCLTGLIADMALVLKQILCQSFSRLKSFTQNDWFEMICEFFQVCLRWKCLTSGTKSWNTRKNCFWIIFFVDFGDGNWRQAEAWIVLLARAVEVNALAQGALRRFTQWLWIEHSTFQLRGVQFTTEL